MALIQQQPPSGGEFIFSLIVPFALCFLVIWFMMIRPQRKQMRERELMLSNIKRNDHILTSGGIFGVVERLKDNEVILKIDEKGEVKIRVARSAIIGVEKVSQTLPEEQKQKTDQQKGK